MRPVSVWGSAKNDVWSVGGAGTLQHWDGSSWSSRDGGTTWLLVDTQPGTDCVGDPAVRGGTCVLRDVQPAFG